MTTIELRQSLLSRGRGAIELTADRLIISMPSYLGELAWQVPLDEVTLVAIEAAEQLNLVPQPSAFVRGLRIPYFHEARAIADPNLLLLFRTPQPVPPLKSSHALRRSRADVLGPVNDLPVLLDGASFQVVDAGGARAALLAVGVTETARPVPWLRTHRDQHVDQERIAALTSTRRWQRIQYWTAPALLLVACVSGVPADLVARGVEAAGVAGFVGFKLLRKFRAPAALTLD